jgi:cytochrome c-type biogenesis protein CcmH
MGVLRSLLVVLGLLLPLTASAVIETYQFDDENLRQRYRTLTEELRCPKCQNQNIADSNAPIAQDLRAQLHTQLHAGRSDDQIIDYMVQRYGEFVLYRPRWGLDTALLWLAPVIFLVLALLIVRGTLRSAVKREDGADTGLSPDDKERLRALVGSDKSGE